MFLRYSILRAWSQNGCLGFLHSCECMKQDRWNTCWRCIPVAVPWPQKESRPCAGRMHQDSASHSCMEDPTQDDQFCVYSAQSRASHLISSFRQMVLWLQECHQDMSCLLEQDFMGTEYFTAPEKHWYPTDIPIRNTIQEKHILTHILNWPNQNHLLLWEVNGGQGPWGSTGKTFICEKTKGGTLSEVMQEWCSPSHPYCQPGLFCSPSASPCGMNHCSSSMKQWAMNTFPCVI